MMSLAITGSEHVGLSPGSVLWNGSLLCAVEMPAGAGAPLLVTAVAVVMFFAMVSLTMVTCDVSSIEMPPPSCEDTLLLIMLFSTVIGKLPACRNRRPPPSSLAALTETKLSVIVTGPAPAEGCVGSAGSWPAIMMPPPSSWLWFSVIVLCVIRFDANCCDAALGM